MHCVLIVYFFVCEASERAVDYDISIFNWIYLTVLKCWDT